MHCLCDRPPGKPAHGRAGAAGPTPYAVSFWDLRAVGWVHVTVTIHSRECHLRPAEPPRLCGSALDSIACALFGKRRSSDTQGLVSQRPGGSHPGAACPPVVKHLRAGWRGRRSRRIGRRAGCRHRGDRHRRRPARRVEAGRCQSGHRNGQHGRLLVRCPPRLHHRPYPRERLVLVQDLVATSDATLLTIHDAVAVFGTPRVDEIRDLVDLRSHRPDRLPARGLPPCVVVVSSAHQVRLSTCGPATLSRMPSTRNW